MLSALFIREILEFVYADDKRAHDRKCLLIFVLLAENDVYEIYLFQINFNSYQLM